MRLPLEAKESECLKLIYNDKLSVEESTELVIPDTCPDVERILDVRGKVMMVSKRAVSEGFGISATVEADVIFSGEDDEMPRSVGAKLSFEFSAIAKGADEDSSILAELDLIKLEARMLNPRKLLVRADVSADVKCYRTDEFVLCSDMPEGGEESVHLLKKEIEHCLVTGITEKGFTVSDEYDMPENHSGAEIVSCITDLCVNDVKTVGNKLVFKATAETNAVFFGSDGEIFTATFETQFSQILETENITDEPEVDIILSLASADFVMLPDREGGAIAVNLKINVQAVCVMHRLSAYVADAYCNKYPFEIESAQTTVLITDGARRQKLRLEGTLNDEQCDVIYLYCGGVGVETDGGKTSFTVRVCGIGKTEGGDFVSLNATLRGSEEVTLEPNQHLMASSVCCCPISCNHSNVVNMDVLYNLTVYSRNELEAICAIEIDTENPTDNEGQPSLVVLCSNGDVSLWSIAKKYGSTMEAIEAANSLCDEFSEKMRPLIIPKA